MTEISPLTSFATPAPDQTAQHSLPDIMGDVIDWQPRHLGPCAFVEHLHLLYWLVGETRPRIAITLGVGQGSAYVAQCDAASHFGFPTQFYGIDPQLDAQPNASDLTETVAAHNARCPAARARLIKADPAQAADLFDIGGIDLLVVDLDPTEPLLHAITETWCPLMSPQGVIVLRGLDQGADALRAQWSCLDVAFGGGVTLVLAGDRPPGTLARLAMTKGDDRPQSQIMAVLRLLGQTTAQQLEQRAPDGQLKALQQDLAATEERMAAQMAAHQAALADLALQQDAALSDMAAQRDQALAQVAAIEDAQKHLPEKLRLLKIHADAERIRLQTALQDARTAQAQQRAEAEATINQLAREKAELEAQLGGGMARPLADAQATPADMTAQIAARDAALADTVAQRDAALAQVATLEQTHQRLQEELRLLTAHAEAERQRLEAAVNEVSAAAEATRVRLEQEKAAAHAQAAQVSANLYSVMDELSTQRAALDAARAEIAQKVQEIAELRSSTSWRVTAPLRKVKTIMP